MSPLILIQLKNGPNEFHFYFVLQPELVAKKKCKKNKQTNKKKRWPKWIRKGCWVIIKTLICALVFRICKKQVFS